MSFSLSQKAESFLNGRLKCRFWVLSPVVLLIATRGSAEEEPYLIAEITPKRKLHQGYLKKLVKVNGINIIPPINVTLNPSGIDRWLLDVDSRGQLSLIGDGDLVVPFFPSEQGNQVGFPKKM